MSASVRLIVAAVLLGVALAVALTWALLVKDVASDRRHHDEHIREIQVCAQSNDPAACFKELPHYALGLIEE